MKLEKGVYLRERNGRYSIRFHDRRRDPSTIERSLDTDHGPLAIERAREKASLYRLGLYDPWTQAQESGTVLEAVDSYVQSRKGEIRDSSLNLISGRLRHFEAKFPPSTLIEHIRKEDIHEYVYGRRLKPSTRCTVYEIVRTWLSWCEKSGLIRENPAAKVPRPKKPVTVPRYLTMPALDRMIRTINSDVGMGKDVAWFRDAVELAATTGLRRNEVCHLRWRDVSDSYITVQSHAGYRAKRDSHGVIPLIPRAGRLIDRMQGERRDEDLDSYVTGVSPKKAYADIGRLFRRYREVAKLPGDVRFHDLRHTFAVMCRMAGIDILDLKDLMRHKKIEQTMIYAQFKPEMLADKVVRAFEAMEERSLQPGAEHVR